MNFRMPARVFGRNARCLSRQNSKKSLAMNYCRRHGQILRNTTWESMAIAAVAVTLTRSLNVQPSMTLSTACYYEEDDGT
mmetsp:Transcript_26390/g.26640  ORF Transcript_26390/g.26640 Transcript_26390/m.26640 type:complete len:80 (-) Transcript_26390:267-506(-)